MFSEPVTLCREPLEKVMVVPGACWCYTPLCQVCSDTTVGEQICRTHYETTCETRCDREHHIINHQDEWQAEIMLLCRFKEHKVEQDEPVCRMVTERKCRDLPGAAGRWEDSWCKTIHLQGPFLDGSQEERPDWRGRGQRKGWAHIICSGILAYFSLQN